MQLLAFASALAFLLALVPPEWLRILWRRPEQDRLQGAVRSLMTLAKTQEEADARVLEPMSAVVGARSISLRDREGHLLGARWLDGDPAAAELVKIATPELALEV